MFAYLIKKWKYIIDSFVYNVNLINIKNITFLTIQTSQAGRNLCDIYIVTVSVLFNNS